MRVMLDSLEKERRDGEWLFTFGVVYNDCVEEVDVYAERVGQARCGTRATRSRSRCRGGTGPP